MSDLSYGCAPLKQIESTNKLKQIENNISALLRGEMAVARMAELPAHKRPLEFRPGVHKSESAKEMLLSQNTFGPLPPSPPSSNPDMFVSCQYSNVKSQSILFVLGGNYI